MLFPSKGDSVLAGQEATEKGKEDAGWLDGDASLHSKGRHLLRIITILTFGG